MDDLIGFLRARLDEEAARAEAAGGDEWALHAHESDTVLIYDSRREPVVYDEGAPSEPQARHIVAHHPARVLAEVAAKRQLVDLYADTERLTPEMPGASAVHWTLRPVLQKFAEVYAAHPDYQPEWSPDA